MSGNSKPDLVTPLIDALSAPSLEVRSVAVQGLARLGDARALKPIMESIRGLAGEDDISQYVSDVMKALTYFDNISALESFASLLDAEFDDLHPIIWHLTAGGDRSTVEEIAEFYEDDVEPLERILNGPYSIDIRKLIIHILWEIDTWSANYVLIDILQDIDEDEYLASEAVHALGWNRFSEAVEPLCAMLADKDRYTADARSYAADALGQIGDPRAVAPLVAILTDPDEDDDILTSSALEALKWLVLSDEEPEDDAEQEMTDDTPPDGNDETFAVLLETLEAPRYRMKELAVRGLAALGDPRAVSPILEAISDPEESEEYRALCRSAIGAIGRIGDASAVTPLFRMLDTVTDECEIFEDYRLGEEGTLDEALKKVAGIGPGIIEPLREVLSGYYSLEIKATAIRTLGYISGPHPVPVLLEALKDISFGGDVAACAADELGIRKVEEAVEDLCRIILDPKHYEEHSRLFAICTLGEIGDPRALGPLREVISDSDTFGALSGEAYEAFESIIEAMESRSENGG
jgi:HEAT repeat protein